MLNRYIFVLGNPHSTPPEVEIIPAVVLTNDKGQFHLIVKLVIPPFFLPADYETAQAIPMPEDPGTYLAPL